MCYNQIAFPTCVHSCTHYFKLLLKGKLITKGLYFSLHTDVFIWLKYQKDYAG